MIFAVMFHHFHGGDHLPSQGSIDAQQLNRLIVDLQSQYTIISSESYTEKILNRNLKEHEICLTFDDALKSQYDIAKPVLDEFGLKGFFFVYSSVFTDKPDELEFYRDFRTNFFRSIDHFYHVFFESVQLNDPLSYKKLEGNYPQDYLAECLFYSENDKRFRYLRDQILGSKKYQCIMDRMLEQHNYDREIMSEKLFMNVENLKTLSREGHTIGLHSTSHPTNIDEFDKVIQAQEYRSNKEFLERNLGCTINSMSHPCGKYNDDTLEVLHDLGIVLGFRKSLDVKYIRSPLEVPRQNHSNLIRGLF